MRLAQAGANFRTDVTVVLCTYQGEPFLGQQLETIESQTVRPDALIISDDGSTDGTLRIAQAFVARSSIPTTIIQNAPGLGFADNFLRASQLAKTEWVAFCDQDDRWLPEKLERCKAFMAEAGVNLIVHRATLIGTDNQEIGPFDQGITKAARLRPLALDPWETYFGFSMVWRRSLLDLVDLSKRPVSYVRDTGEGMAHDRWISFLATVCGSIVELPDRLVQYRQHDSNLYGAKSLQPRKHPLSALNYWNDRRISAARRLIEIITEFNPSILRGFADFDRTKAERQLRRSLEYVLARRRIYLRSGVMGPVALICELFAGRYNAIGRSGFRKRSILTDLAVSVQKL